MVIIIFIISILLNKLILLNVPYMFGSLSLFTPMFYLVTLAIIYPLYRIDKDFLVASLIMGLVMDILNNTIGISICLYFICYLVIKFLDKFVSRTPHNQALVAIIIIGVYETIFVLILNILGQNISIYDLIYKVSHSIISNVIYVFFFSLFLSKYSKRYSKK